VKTLPHTRWSKWAKCPTCRRHYNQTSDLDFAYPECGSRSKEDYADDMARARTYFKQFHEGHVGVAA
jgi:hypothetical protein